ncbi:MAG TPA: hypothetical protein VE913_00475 [Longimicrobium sp.]|nr:hypothetical protein [Longimicrobium sp.]
MSDFPARPASEVEWEDLLVRMEITPRALRAAVSDAPAGHSAILRELGGAVARERWLEGLLDDLREGKPVRLAAVPDGGESGTEAELLDEFSRLRGRNFARVQRRGIDVWDWKSDTEDGTLTAYQALLMTTRADGALLAATRAAGREG